MKFQKNTLFVCFFMAMGISSANSQCKTVSGGGIGIGSGGSLSFAIGQGFTISMTNEKMNSSKIIKQTLQEKIFSNESDGILVDIKIFPNPTKSNVVLRISNVVNDEFYYQLYDLIGSRIMNKEIKSVETNIYMDNLVDGIYLLKVLENNREIKIFKIIKNQ
jgi:hypothetical protein